MGKPDGWLMLDWGEIHRVATRAFHSYIIREGFGREALLVQNGLDGFITAIMSVAHETACSKPYRLCADIVVKEAIVWIRPLMLSFGKSVDGELIRRVQGKLQAHSWRSVS